MKTDMEDWDDVDLWEAARSTIPSAQRERMESLHFKQQSEGLTEEEQEEVKKLEELYIKVVLTRA